MKTGYKKLSLPDFGSKSNWAALINDNFRKIDDELYSLSSKIDNNITVGAIGEGDGFIVLQGNVSFNKGQNKSVLEFNLDNYTGIDTSAENIFINLNFYIRQGTSLYPCFIYNTVEFSTIEKPGSNQLTVTISADTTMFNADTTVIALCQINIKNPTLVGV